MSDENINICINVVTKKSIKDAGTQLDTLGNKGKNAGKKIENAAVSSSSRLEKIKTAGIVAAAGLSILTAAAAKAINNFKSFENGLINVEKVTNISGKNLASFGKEIDRLANRIPVGTSELLNIAQTAGQLGIEGSKNILAFTESVALLTRTTDLSIESAQSLAQLIEVTRTAPEDVGTLAAVIVELGNNFSATESQILEVSTRIAQSTTSFNLLAEDAVKLGAVIAGVGEKAEASGTAIGKTFRSLESAIVSGGPALEKLIDLTGLQQDQLSKLFESNPTELLRKFTQGLNEAKKSGELIPVILAEFGLRTDRVNRVLGPLIKNTDKVNEAFKRTEDQVINQNAAIEEANKQFRSLASAEILASNAATQLSKTIGEELQPIYRSILETIRTVSIELTRFVQDGGIALDLIKVAIIGIGISFAALAAVAAVAFTGITFGIAILIAKVVAVGLAIGAIVVFWDDIKKAATTAIEEIGLFFLKLKLSALDFYNSISFLQNRQTEDMKRMADATREQIKLIEKRQKTRREEQDQAEKQKKIDEDNIQRVRELEDRQESLRKVILLGNKEKSIAAQKEIKSIDEQIQAINGLATEEKQIAFSREENIKRLRTQRDLLNVSIETASLRNQQGIAREIESIDQQILKIKELGLAEDNQKKIDEEKKRTEQILEVRKNLEAKLVLISKTGDEESTNGLKIAVTKQSEVLLKKYRDDAIALGEFNIARRAEVELDLIETQNKKDAAAQKEKDKAISDRIKLNQELSEIKEERKELEKEEVLIEAELKIEKDAQELEQLRERLKQIQIVKIEGQEREAELEKNQVARLAAIREKEDKKSERILKFQTNKQIRDKKAFNAVQIELDKTTGQALTDIGDNLFKAGIIRGKTAGTALKALKISEATVNTYTGATLALSQFPGPAGIVAAAGVVASGLASVATIASQKFATGGIVQPSGTASRGIDNIPALLSVGEEVLTRNNPRHRDNISRESDQALLEAVQGLRTDIQGMQTIVTIDGKEVADVIQEQRFRGVR